MPAYLLGMISAPAIMNAYSHGRQYYQLSLDFSQSELREKFRSF